MPAPLLSLLLLALAWSPALQASPDPAALQAALHGSDPEAAEARIAAALRDLRDLPASPARRALVAAFLDHEETSRQPHPENPAHSLPRHGIQALARAQWRRWEQAAAIAELNTRPVSALGKAGAVPPETLRAWILQAGEEALADFVATADPAHSPEPVLLALLERAPTPAWWFALAERGRSAAAIRQLQAASTRLPPQRYAALLDRAASNPALAPSATVLRGHLAREDATQAAELRAALRTKTLHPDLVDSALAAEFADLVSLFEARLPEPESAAAAAWGLWRLGSPEARAALVRYTRQPTAIAHLREEIGTWLD